MADDFSERRPYNAVSDFVDANVARGLGRQDRLHRSRPLAHLWRPASAQRPLRQCLADARSRGAKSGSRCCCNDTVDYPVAFWGAIRAGNVALPLNTFLNVSQYAYILADSRASALVVAAPLAQAIWPILDRLPYLRTVILVGATSDGLGRFPGRDVHLFEDVIAQAQMPRRSPPTPCRTKSRSGSTPPARPAIRRASSTSIPT